MILGSYYLNNKHKTNAMGFDIELTNNSATALTAGTSNSLVFSKREDPRAKTTGNVYRSVAAVQTTLPHVMTIGHSTRVLKGLRLATGLSGPPIIFDRHMVRIDKCIDISSLGILDPEYLVNRAFWAIWEIPRLGALSPTAQLHMDDALRVMALTNPSSNAGFIKLANGES
jgi:hypothetical protein